MAMAPEHTGIGIRRRFTTKGIHPYDMVTWERRDARITNYRDGSVAFEQLGVEVPSDWSLNATNILAQKYFRGSLGTSERESSLKQVADRVVDTITGWGRRDGYFVDDEEAEAFSDELKYLIITQRAAFNSPVWFNIGVKGVSQQASACFILSVDDTMDSILNWYTEEGTIFKGGSGAGVNLSKIRSSVELLKGGGTASGPVSFMRGADASAGTIKCLHDATEIFTDQGVLPIRDARPGMSVLTRFGLRPILAVHDNGIRPLVRVETSLGDELLCTPEHRFRVRGRDGESWREAGQIREDDYVMVDLDPDDVGTLQQLVPVPTAHHNEIAHELPEHLDEAFALWLGWIFGDGSITTRPGAKYISVQVDDSCPELVGRYEDITRSIFGSTVHLYASRHKDKADASSAIRFASGQVIRFLDANGLSKRGSHQLSVPDVVKSSPAAVRAAFLGGLFEADGHVGNGYPWLSAVSEQLARDVQRLLLSIGVPAKLSCVTDRPGAFGHRPLYIVRVVGGEGVRRFAKLVGFVSERKSAALTAAVERKDRSSFETQWTLPHVRSELDTIWRTSRNPEVRRAIAPYCRYRRARSMSLLRARALLDRFPEELAETSLARFTLGAELYLRVSVSDAGEGATFDLSVQDVHEYTVHGLVTHNSGGKTRRAAKMVILDVDHPDIEEFIWCKANEESKARVLRDAGFDMDLDGRDIHSIQYQNANNSVRVTEEFMQAVVDDADWHLRAVKTGEIVKTVRARDLMRQISQATWECADPGMQFDTTINRWHTSAATGRINASNPCFPGDAMVHTDKGLVSFKDLLGRARLGEPFGIYTHDATNPDSPAERVEVTTPEAIMITGFNEIVKLRFSNGCELRCTPNHHIFTVNRGYVQAGDLMPEDRVKTLDLPTPPVMAELRLPIPTDVVAYAGRDIRTRRNVELPEKWDEEFAHYLGWLLGDGCISGDVATTVYGTAEEQDAILPKHQALLARLNGGRRPTPSLQANGTAQLRQSRSAITRMFEALGFNFASARHKALPWAINEAPEPIAAAFLRGLFDADGCVVDTDKSRYVGLGSVSRRLLVDVQRLLSTFGIFGRIYTTRKKGDSSFTYLNKAGELRTSVGSDLHDLRISGASMHLFADAIGFSLPGKARKIAVAVGAHRRYSTDRSARLVERVDDGVELTYNLTEPRNHSYVVNGIVVRNCSEYMHLDNSACNLASLNLLKFLDNPTSGATSGDDTFDVEGFKHAVGVVFTGQEILVGNADYPTKSIGDTSRRFRQLGIGYANLGALLMALGLPYDSDEGRAWAGAITALMTGHAYVTSARTAARMGPFAGFADNEAHMLRVLGMHRAEAAEINEELVPFELLAGAQEAWDEACETAQVYGVRNSQASVLAPTGTIGLLMDCDTTGIEPDLGLCKMKKLVGGGTMTIVNQTIPRALTRLGYTTDQVGAIVAYIDEHKTILGAPHLDPEHVPVFACSMGDNTIHYSGHVKMMAAAQPFLSGAISKTINMSEQATVEEVEQLHIESWRLGLKAVAIYRDNCKVSQPMATAKKEDRSDDEAIGFQMGSEVVERVVEKIVEKVVEVPVRERLPRTRTSRTFEFRVADCKGFVTAGEYDDGRPGEIFVRVSKQGSTLAGIMDAFAIAISHGLQYGVPLRSYIEAFTGMRFEPAGMTDDPDIRIANSLMDYLFRKLAVMYLSQAERAELNIFTIQERMQPTLPGVEETVVETVQGQDLPADPPSIESANELATRIERSEQAEAGPRPSAGPGRVSDAPMCMQCGVQMQRAGSCHACPSCGSTSGCS